MALGDDFVSPIRSTVPVATLAPPLDPALGPIISYRFSPMETRTLALQSRLCRMTMQGGTPLGNNTVVMSYVSLPGPHGDLLA